MGNAAVKAAKAVAYSGAGTVEFIYDYRNRKYYFMEMNTRIQVEHPVTEMVTGIDLIKEQIRVASGEKLTYNQQDVTFTGWSIECRSMQRTLKRISCPLQEKLICICLLAVLVFGLIQLRTQVIPFHLIMIP